LKERRKNTTSWLGSNINESSESRCIAFFAC
jgi:hypothetical protein